MEFLKNIGRGLLVVAAMLTVLVGVAFAGALVLEFNDWLYAHNQSLWSVFWYSVGAGIVVILLAGLGKKNREWTGG